MNLVKNFTQECKQKESKKVLKSHEIPGQIPAYNELYVGWPDLASNTSVYTKDYVTNLHDSICCISLSSFSDTCVWKYGMIDYLSCITHTGNLILIFYLLFCFDFPLVIGDNDRLVL